MKNGNLQLKINEHTGAYEVVHNGFSWVSDGRTEKEYRLFVFYMVK